jgi:hypothetical protein
MKTRKSVAAGGDQHNLQDGCSESRRSGRKAFEGVSAKKGG